MEFEEAARFMQTFHRGVVTTTKKNGAGQMSILSSGPYKGGAAFVARGSTAKDRQPEAQPAVYGAYSQSQLVQLCGGGG